MDRKIQVDKALADAEEAWLEAEEKLEEAQWLIVLRRMRF
jgi:hypothetical protein